ncbi:hypothetical protein QL285_068604 [Trifolium repens]|nr:hypothetical protein QL285_068604 [Trifolium repens]
MNGCDKVSFNNPKASHSQSSSNVPYLIIIPHFPLPSQAIWMYCMSAVDISFCGLSQVPDAIGCLHQLQRLNLGGNNFVSLLSLNLNEFSKLVYLNLDHCMFLESLPQLPSPTAINWNLDTNRGPLEIGLHIFNCPKLGERECIFAFSWLKQFIQANQQCSHAIDIVIPGIEMPSWFNNQSKGDKTLIDNFPIIHDINNDIIGFVCCSVFSVEPSTRPFGLCYRSAWGTAGLVIKLHLTGFYLDRAVDMSYHENFLPVYCKGRDLIKVKRNHIWLTYLPRKLSWYVPDFHGTMHVKFGSHNKVKNCGYGWLHKQGLQEFNLTTMHPGNSSALKSKILAIEDIHSSD